MVVNKVLRKVLLAVLFCLFFAEISATHIIGGDITYQCVGSGKYKIVLTVYTECGSDAILEQYYPIQYYATDLGILPGNPRTFNVNKISTQEVQLYCNTAVTDCKGGSQRGVEKVIYEGTVTLASQSSDWRFFWKRAARSEDITTLEVPEAEDFFIEASINSKAAACNQSVVFEGTAVLAVCVNQDQTFNNLATDPDGDHLKFSLETPKSNYDTDVVFIAGFSAVNFLPFTTAPVLDHNSGDLEINPSDQMVGITDFKVEEFRNGKSIGWVKRGIQITSIDCSNTIPTISDFTSLGTDSVSVCAGDLVNLSFDIQDADNQNVSVTLLDGPAGIFSVSGNNTPSPTGRLYWSTSQSDVGVYNIVVQASDNECPQPGIAVKTFVLNVRSAPQFSLGGTQQVACNETLTLSPTVTGGDGSYSYLWSDGSTGSTNEVGLGYHTLTVTDGTGCSKSSSVFVTGELYALFSAFPLCIGVPTQFMDLSEHQSPTKSIASWSWDFGDGSTSTEQHPLHTFATAGTYDVVLEITDDGTPSCTTRVSLPMTICAPPGFDFTSDGHCTYHPVTFNVDRDLTDECNNIQMLSYDFGDGTIINCNSSNGSCSSLQHTYDAPGFYDVAITATNSSGCKSTVRKQLEIFASPEVNIIQDDFFLICSKPDSLIETEILQGGTGAIEYLWNTNETTEDITVSSAGLYTILATDEKECTSSDVLLITYPLSAFFKYDPYCEAGDVVQFHNFSVSQTNTITSYSWNFDDIPSGVANTSTLENPQHEFSQEGDYNVRLVVEDSDGCQREFAWPVYNSSIDNHFELNPSEEVCLGSQLVGTGPDGNHINSYQWNFGDGSKGYARQSAHTYYSSGNYNINLSVNYNSNSIATSGCTTEFSDDIYVNARPVAQIRASQDRFCMYEPITFDVETTSDIQAVEWEVVNLRNGTRVTSDVTPFVHRFSERAEYRVELTVTDVNGCTTYDSRTGFAGRVVIPDFNFETLCAKELLTFEEAFRDTLENITDYRWDFGDGTVEEGPVPIPLTTHAFKKGGIYPVTLTVINSFSDCGSSKTKMVKVLAAPVIDFTYDTICARSKMSFTNLTTEGEGAIESYQWIFPDGSTASTENASFYFEEPGHFPVSLVSTSTLGCSDTLTHSVYVKPAPVAGVEIPVSFVEAYIPIQFYDDSEGDITSFFWDFGDGVTTSEQDPIHTFDAIDQYPLTHIVTNAFECSDTLKMMLDLNVYLNLPTAFSPNNDNKNDELRLIQQGIKTLYTFKLFNRHGQEVFDAQGNVEAVWDGNYNDRPQPSGVYIAHVKALGAYGKEFNFKKNVTLLR